MTVRVRLMQSEAERAKRQEVEAGTKQETKGENLQNKQETN